MSDPRDEPFVPLSPYSYEAHRWQRYSHEPPLVSGKVVLLAVACVVLAGFVNADVAALYRAPPAAVEVTAVEWFIPGALLSTSAGFSMHSSEQVTVTLTCSNVCFRISGAAVESPFTLVGFSVVYAPDQYTNVTVKSPSSAYIGPIAVELSLG